MSRLPLCSLHFRLTPCTLDSLIYRRTMGRSRSRSGEAETGPAGRLRQPAAPLLLVLASTAAWGQAAVRWGAQHVGLEQRPRVAAVPPPTLRHLPSSLLSRLCAGRPLPCLATQLTFLRTPVPCSATAGPEACRPLGVAHE